MRYYRYNPDQTEQIIQLLKELLSNTYLLYIQTQGCHWNVVGTDFPQLHTLFQTQYEELALAVDVIAEHLRTYYSLAPGSAKEFLQLSSIDEIDFTKDFDNTTPNASSFIRQLIANNQLCSDIAQKLGNITDDKINTQDLAAARMDAHKKAIWMLRSSLDRSKQRRYRHRRYHRRRNPYGFGAGFRRNPWSAGDVRRHNKACASKSACRRKWPSIANAILREDHDEGKAIRIANWQTKRMGLY